MGVQELLKGILPGGRAVVNDVDAARLWSFRPPWWFPVLVFACVVAACG